MNLRFFVLLLTSVFSTSLFGTTCLADEMLYTAKYASHYSGMDVKIIRTLSQRTNGTYQYEFDADSRLVNINDKSEFTLVDNRIIAQHYAYKRKILGLSKRESVEFNWGKNTANYFTSKNKIHTHSLQPGVLDSSLYQLQLQKDLYNGAEKLRYTYIQRDNLREREFVIVGDTQFTLQGTTYKALRLERLNRSSEKLTQVIVIPELMYIIAYIKQVRDEDEFETKLTDLTLNSANLAKLYNGQP